MLCGGGGGGGFARVSWGSLSEVWMDGHGFSWTQIWCRNGLWTGAILRGGLCCLGEEAGVCWG